MIHVEPDGRFDQFEMNDRCAAGTGRFMEVMAKTLGFRVEEFGIEALKAKKPVNISSTCTVFSESEVVSLLANGSDRRSIALGVHQAIITRLASMANKVGIREDIVFAGGVAKNTCIASLLAKRLHARLFIPTEPQMLGALGATLSLDSNSRTKTASRKRALRSIGLSTR